MTSVSLTKGAAETVERDARGRIRLTSAGNRNMSVQLTLLVLAVLTVVTFVRMDFGSTDLAAATSQALSDFYAMMVQPALDPPLGASHFTWEILIESALITLAITAICTVISAIVSFFLALAASENLSNPAVSNVVKGFVAVIRSIPTILWVLVFTVAIGLGAEAAVLGISFHSIAYLVKSYSESFEEIDAGVIEALRASGASFWHRLPAVPGRQPLLQPARGGRHRLRVPHRRVRAGVHLRAPAPSLHPEQLSREARLSAPSEPTGSRSPARTVLARSARCGTRDRP